MEASKSIQAQLNRINRKVMLIAYESNPIRKGWEEHKIEKQKFKLRDNPEWYDKYYLLECYSENLSDTELNLLWGYADGLVQKSFFNWLNGRTSLASQINMSMDDWEIRFNKDHIIVNAIMDKRNEFILKNKRQ